LVSSAKNSRNWNWMEYRLFACVCSWCWSVGWWYVCCKQTLNCVWNTIKSFILHVRTKRTMNVVLSHLQMAWKFIIAFGPPISMWTIILENLVHVDSSEKLWPICQIYIYRL
jgi:hypothetical protein